MLGGGVCACVRAWWCVHRCVDKIYVPAILATVIVIERAVKDGRSTIQTPMTFALLGPVA